MKRRTFFLGLAALPLMAGSGRAAPRTHVIEISGMAFGPAPSGIHAGDTILWRNKDLVPHTATARDGAFDVSLAPGAEGSVMVGKAGSVAYFCRFHPMMTGTLTIQP